MKTLISFLLFAFVHSSAFAEVIEVEYHCVFSDRQTRDKIQIYGVYRSPSRTAAIRPFEDVHVQAESRSGVNRLNGPMTDKYDVVRMFGPDTARIYRDGRRFGLNAAEQNGSTIEVSPGEGNDAAAFIVLNLKETATRPAYSASGDGTCRFE